MHKAVATGVVALREYQGVCGVPMFADWEWREIFTIGFVLEGERICGT